MKQALIIGATGGIGAAVAAHLETVGTRVTRLSRAADGFDVTDPSSIAQHLAALPEGAFDLVFVALGTLAAGGAPEKALRQIDGPQMAKVMSVNAIGPALILAQTERLLPKDRPSTVGILSARVGSIGDNRAGGWHSYRASKAALNQIIRGAAIEIGRKRPQACIAALHPGTVATPFTKNYPAHAKVSPADAAANLVGVMESLTPAETGGFFDYSGAVVPW